MSKLHLNMDEHRAFWGGVDMKLTAGEFRTLAKLASRPGRYLTYRDIYDTIQSPGFIAGDGYDGYRGNVRSMIKRVRKKFLAIDPNFDGIQNFLAVGYTLKAEVMAHSTCCPTCGQIVIALAQVVVGKNEIVANDDWAMFLPE